jgi:hypothetical protein
MQNTIPHLTNSGLTRKVETAEVKFSRAVARVSLTEQKCMKILGTNHKNIT